MREISVPRTTKLGVPVSLRRTFDKDGSLIGEARRQQILTSWDRVFELLRSSFPDARYHRGKGFVRAENAEDGVHIWFNDGSTTETDLLIGADGFRSSV